MIALQARDQSIDLTTEIACGEAAGYRRDDHLPGAARRRSAGPDGAAPRPRLSAGVFPACFQGANAHLL
jgi:hypothetical protein